jgi:hypothetical protein
VKSGRSRAFLVPKRTVAVSGTKSATGHLLGAAGGLKAIFTVLALINQIEPRTLKLNAPDPEADGIDFVANEAHEYAIEMASALAGSMPVHASGAGQKGRWPETAARAASCLGAWSYRHPARVTETIRVRLEGLPKAVREIAWKVHTRLCDR